MRITRKEREDRELERRARIEDINTTLVTPFFAKECHVCGDLVSKEKMWRNHWRIIDNSGNTWYCTRCRPVREKWLKKEKKMGVVINQLKTCREEIDRLEKVSRAGETIRISREAQLKVEELSRGGP